MKKKRLVDSITETEMVTMVNTTLATVYEKFKCPCPTLPAVGSTTPDNQTRRLQHLAPGFEVTAEFRRIDRSPKDLQVKVECLTDDLIVSRAFDVQQLSDGTAITAEFSEKTKAAAIWGLDKILPEYQQLIGIHEAILALLNKHFNVVTLAAPFVSLSTECGWHLAVVARNYVVTCCNGVQWVINIRWETGEPWILTIAEIDKIASSDDCLRASEDVESESYEMSNEISHDWIAGIESVIIPRILAGAL